jgi:hypothetical protein
MKAFGIDIPDTFSIYEFPHIMRENLQKSWEKSKKWEVIDGSFFSNLIWIIKHPRKAVRLIGWASTLQLDFLILKDDPNPPVYLDGDDQDDRGM